VARSRVNFTGYPILASQHKSPAKEKAVKGKSIAAHPLFPAVVALWFGALFGLGSLAIRVGLIESLVLATRIDTVVPAAAPPLGVSARILLALVLAAGGALLGASIARRIARPKPEVRERKRTALATSESPVSVRARDSHPDAPARRPISATEELGEAQEEIAAMPAGGRRRTALAIEHEQTFELHEAAPLPGGMPQILPAERSDDTLDLAAFDNADHAAEAFAPPPAVEQPRTDWSAANPVDVSHDVVEAKQMFRTGDDHADAEPLNFSPPADAVSGRQVFGMATPQPDEVLDELGITDAEFEDFHPVEIPVAETVPVEAVAAPVAATAADLEAKPAIIELAEQLGMALQRRRERVALAAAAAIEAAEAVLAAPIKAEPAENELPVAQTLASEVTNEVADTEPSGSVLSTIDAAEPFSGFTHPNDIPAPFNVPEVAPVSQLPESAIEPTDANPSWDEARLPVIPAALRPLVFDGDDHEHDDSPLASLLPPRSIRFADYAPPAALHAEAVDEPEEEPEAEAEVESSDGFSSLLELGRAVPIRQNFIRIEEPAPHSDTVEPVVIFPGQAALSLAPQPSQDDSRAESPADDSDQLAQFRRFDSPTLAEAGQPVAAAPVSSHQAEETEQALRAALANLQRMSGAA